MAEPEGRKYGRYWRFYWPLTLTGLSMLIAQQLRNAILARYPEGTEELALFAMATSFFAFLHATLAFMPQLANVHSRSPHALRLCFRFVLWITSVLTVPLLWLGWTDSGSAFVARVFRIEGDALGIVIAYLRILAPLLIVDGLRHCLTGLLVQAQRTGIVTVLNFVYLGLVLLVLLTGFSRGYSAMLTVSLSQVLPALVSLGLLGWMYRRHYRLPVHQSDENLAYRDLWTFFWPIALTSMMFALSRPVIFFFASRTPDAVVLIAALRVAFDLSLIFCNPVNQFRHLFVTFGLGDLEGLRRFLRITLTVLVGTMLIMAVTPIHSFVLHQLLGVEGDTLATASNAFLVLCLVPVAMGLRNYFHGLSLVNRTTGRMGFGSLVRIGTIVLVCWLLQAAGWLNGYTGASVLFLGFFSEALTVMFYTRWRERRAA